MASAPVSQLVTCFASSRRMQTFLPFACVDKSLRRLDHKRLHKQLTEAIQILQILRALRRGEEPKYRNHPVVLMWVGHETFLRYYACRCSVVIKETTHRVSDGLPYNTILRDKALTEDLGGWIDAPPLENAPVWFGNDDFHGSHRAALYRKRPDIYSEFQEDSLRYSYYIWPVKRSEEEKKAARHKNKSEERKKRSVSSPGITKVKEALPVKHLRSLRRIRSAPARVVQRLSE